MKRLLLIMAGLLIANPAIGAITGDVVSASNFDPDIFVLQANLGIDGSYTIEDFEDSILAPGLEVQIDGLTMFTPLSVGAEEEYWCGTSVLHNVDDVPQDGQDVTLVLSSPCVTRFGIGISHLEQVTRILVNGIEIISDVRSDSDWSSGGPNTRNGYLWITATDGDAIQSVTFDGTNLSDSFYLDHAAWIAGDILTVSLPNSSTTYTHNQPAVSANWAGAPSGGTVTAELYRGNILIDLYHNETLNDGDLNRAGCPETWGVGDDFRVKITHVQSGCFGWSEPFSIECDPSTTCLEESFLVCNPLNGHSYFLSGYALTAGAAEAWARDHGGHLVTINDVGENQWLVDTFGGAESYWIGLYQPQESPEPDAAWEWLNMELNTFRNWASGAPDDGGGLFSEDSVVMNDVGPGLWNDVEGIPTDANSTLSYRAIAEVPGNPCPSDLNCDGIVDTADLGILIGAFGQPCN